MKYGGGYGSKNVANMPQSRQVCTVYLRAKLMVLSDCHSLILLPPQCNNLNCLKIFQLVYKLRKLLIQKEVELTLIFCHFSALF